MAMPKISFRDHNGSVRTVEAENGSTVMETAIHNAIPGILAECGGACACATCHVYVDEAFMPLVGDPAPMEEDMLDFAYDVRPIRACPVRSGSGTSSTACISHDAREAGMSAPFASTVERYPIAGAFTIARGSKAEAAVVVAEVTDGQAGAGRMRTLCAAMARPSRASPRRSKPWRAAIEAGLDRDALQAVMPPGAARNASTAPCGTSRQSGGACRRGGSPGLRGPAPHHGLYAVARGAGGDAPGGAAQASRPLLKVKLGTEDDAPASEPSGRARLPRD